MFTRTNLVNDLISLGVKAGDVLFVHSSFKSLGSLEAGAETAVAALLECVGEEGLVLMPSFNLSVKGTENRIAQWDVNTTPSSVGWLTEFFRTRPGTVRSNHYCHSVAVAGRHAQEFLANPDPDAGPDSPWDAPGFPKGFGTHSPMGKAYRNPNGRILMLGVDYHSSTYMHYVEVLYWEKRKATDPDAPYRYLKRETLGEFWDAAAPISRGQVGSADSRLFPISDFVDGLLAEVEKNPMPYCK